MRLPRWSICVLLLSLTASAQKVSGSLEQDLREFVQIPAIPGYEQELATRIALRLQALKPTTDEMANVVVTLGTGSPHRLLVAPMDEPGYVVSAITTDGYLRVQRLPQGGALPLFNELYSAQPVTIGARQQRWISGAVAGLSIHLQPQVQHPPSPSDLDNMYIDIGAGNEQQARAAGADLLSPMAIERNFYAMANGNWTSPAIGDRFGDAVLVEMLRNLDPQKLHGTLTVAFVAQQWTDSRGLDRMLQSLKPDEVIYVGRLIRRSASPAGVEGAASETAPASGFSQKPGSGVLLGVAGAQAELSGLAAELKQLAGQNGIPFHNDSSGPIVPATRRGSLPRAPLPARWAHLAVGTAWPSTPAEFVDAHDLAQLAALLESYLQGQAGKIEISAAQPIAEPRLPQRPTTAPGNEAILKSVIEAYGVSGGHEAAVRETVAHLLPSWAKPQTDSSGNLTLRWGTPSGKPRVLVVAHQDEIGFEVRSILPDGRLELQTEGGGVLAYFMGHAAFVHSANGIHAGVLELPEGWDKDEFKWPRGPRTQFRLDVGTRNPEEATQLGIKAGDFVTIPKKYHKLAGTRATARAFDDRMGCAALVSAVWALGPELKGRDVSFVWSTSEEIGLVGAAAVAKQLAAEGHAPDYVFAVDTFVSADSPFESKRFADATLGQGFVVRAVDNSNVVPPALVEKIVSLARANHTAVQYGVTGGGNDGSAFLQYGSTDVALGWPLRYSHSPAEVIDTRDLDALARIIAAVAKSW
ncbi:MAG TPA: M20/M25/M40 family metallo-hydrolase [Candidatus Angelobacter sp.]|nr:M20/M25/M40 family metallo-hydrolase [Candidatus Angelobacter sp.]